MKKNYISPKTTTVELNLMGSVLENIGVAGGSKGTGPEMGSAKENNFDFYNEEFENEETQGKSYNLWD